MIITDLETWLIDNKNENKIYRVEKIKKVFTPYEIEEKFSDEQTSELMGDYLIKECIELQNKDVLLGMKAVAIGCEDSIYNKVTFPTIEYFKLSEIDITDVTNTDEYRDLEWWDGDV